MAVCEPNRARLLCMLSLTFGFFIVEVVVSRLTASLAMLSDSFHMLSDVIALVVALVAARFAQRTTATDKNTFGWIRAEVMGALVNAVFLTALCFTVVLEAVERFTEPHEIESPKVVVAVGAAGLAVNLLGLCMFRGHAHGGGHGHSHGGGGKKGKKGSKPSTCNNTNSSSSAAEEETNNLVPGHGTITTAERRGRTGTSHDGCVDIQINGNAPYDPLEHDHSHDTASLNMRGVFLHVLGDALGSVIVVINAIIFTFVWQPCEPGVPCINPCVNSHCTDHQHINHTLVGIQDGEHGNHSSLGDSSIPKAGPCWVLYLDPTLCVIMVCILLYTTYPLLKESALILLQTVPKQIDMHSLNSRLQELEGVLAVHELHIWQLAGSRIIATAHIKCHDPASYMDVAKRIKAFFHDEGIHATTIQPEFVTVNSESRASLCELSCRTQCATKQCCGSGDGPKSAEMPAAGQKAITAGNAAVASTSAMLEVINESLENAVREQEGKDQGAPRAEQDVIIAREVESSL